GHRPILSPGSFQSYCPGLGERGRGASGTPRQFFSSAGGGGEPSENMVYLSVQGWMIPTDPCSSFPGSSASFFLSCCFYAKD
ncbi:mCG1030883, partial [Mus musculus]